VGGGTGNWCGTYTFDSVCGNGEGSVAVTGEEKEVSCLDILYMKFENSYALNEEEIATCQLVMYSNVLYVVTVHRTHITVIIVMNVL
jgi:hypothetical protein